MPRYAPNKMSSEVKRRYFELIRSGFVRIACVAEGGRVAQPRVAVVHRRLTGGFHRRPDQPQGAYIRLLRGAEGPLLVPSPVIGEIGYLLQSRGWPAGRGYVPSVIRQQWLPSR